MKKKKNSNPIDLNINLKLSLKPILNKKFALNGLTAYGYYLLIGKIISAYKFYFSHCLLVTVSSNKVGSISAVSRVRSLTSL